MYNRDYNNAPAVEDLIWPDFDHNSIMSKKLIQTKNLEGEEFWNDMRKIISHDCSTLPLNNFKTWASVLAVPFFSPFLYSDYVTKALIESRNDKRVFNALTDIGVGVGKDSKIIYPFFDCKFTPNRMLSYGNYAFNGWGPKELSSIGSILEIGSGSAEMCDIAYRLGFEGKYTIYDFPEIHTIQKYYMGELGNDKVEYVSDIDKLETYDLVISNWALTEMPLDLRSKLLSRVGTSKNWLLAYSKFIFNIDNQKYINETFIPTYAKDKKVIFVSIDGMPWHNGCFYLSAKENGI